MAVSTRLHGHYVLILQCGFDISYKYVFLLKISFNFSFFML